MPRSTTPKATKPTIYNPPQTPITVNHEVKQPGLFGSMVQGFGLGMGSSIARNMFEHRPAVTPTPTKVETPDKAKTFKLCMEKTYNNYNECVHHLE